MAPSRHALKATLLGLAITGLLLSAASSARADFGFITQWGASGSQPGQFKAPVAIATDAQSNVYVVDSSLDNVQKFDSTGRYLASFGAPHGPDCTVTLKLAPPGQLCVPHGLAITGSSVYVVDTYGGRIQQFTTSGRFVRTFGSLYCAQGPRPPGPVFCFPGSDAVDSAGNVYVQDAGATIQVFKPAGSPLTSWPGPLCALGCFNQALAMGPRNTLYVADSFWGLVAATLNALSDTPGGLLVNGIWGGNGTAPAQFSDRADNQGPWGVAADAAGNVYVADNANNRIQVFASLGAFKFAFGRAGRGPGQFANPRGVAAAPNGNVYVADSDNDRVEKFGQIPSNPPPVATPPEPNTTAPELGGLALQFRTFRTGLTRPGRRSHGTPRGTNITLRLDQPATVTLSFARRSGARVGHLTVAGATGINRFRFNGRVGSRRLRAGRYRLSARAVDGQGLPSATRRLAFTVAR